MFIMITSEEYKELVIKANKYDESQKVKPENKKADEDEKVVVGKLEGKEAEKFINIIEKVIKEDK